MGNKCGMMVRAIFLPLVLGIFLLSVLAVSSARGADSVGTFTRVEGRVEVIRGSRAAQPVTTGAPVFVGDLVRTKSGASAEISFEDGGVLRLAQRSRIDIEQYLSGRQGEIGLVRGKVDASIPPNPDLSPGAKRFEIHTPNAVAGVRGTRFTVILQGNVTAIVVREGTVYTYNPRFPGQVVSVPAGQTNTVVADSPPTQPRPATDTELQGIDSGSNPPGGEEGGSGSGENESNSDGNNDSGDGFNGGGPPAGGSDQTGSGGTDSVTTESVSLLSGATLESVTSVQNGPSGPPIIQTDIGDNPTSSTDQPDIPLEVVDSTAPTVDVPLPPAPVNNQRSITLILTADEPVTFAVDPDNNGFQSLNTQRSDTIEVNLPFEEGEHHLIVQGTDAAGNVGTYELLWTSDFTGPALAFAAAPAGQTNAVTAGFTLSSSEAVSGLTYNLDDGPAQPFSGDLSLSGLAEGNHTLTVMGTDAAGNSGSTTFNWTVDLTAPTVGFSSTPAALTNSAAAGFTLSSSEAVSGSTYSLDGGPAQPFSGDLSLTGLAERNHTLSVTAVDGAGNSGSATFDWTVDLTPPTGTPALSVSPGTDPATIDLTVNYGGSEPATFSYTVDGGSGFPLGDGSHVLDYTAIDAAGNTAVGNLIFSLRSYSLAGAAADGADPLTSNVEGGVSLISAGDSGWRSGLSGVLQPGETPPATFSLNSGGKLIDAGGGMAGLWLSLADGSSDPLSGTMTGTSSFRLLTPTGVGSASGILDGSFGSGAWQITEKGQGLIETPLKFFAEADAEFSSLVFGHSGSLSYINDPYRTGGDFYYYDYDGGKTFGHSSYVRTSQGIREETDYFPDGTTEMRSFVLDGSGIWQLNATVSGTWDPGTTDLALVLGTPPDAAQAYLTWTKDGLIRSHSGEVTGGLGGITSLWGATAAAPAPVTLLGELKLGAPGSQLVSGRISSADEAAGTPTTYDGGAFTGLFTGAESDQTIRGGMAGLYVDPTGGAGYLRGSLSGTAYTGSGMTAMDGNLYLQPVETPGWLNAGNFNASVWQTFSSGYRFAADFGSGSSTAAETVSELQTLSLVDQATSATSSWGVFRSTQGGAFSSTGAAAWTATAGGRGSFGAVVRDAGTSPYCSDDEGFWVADLSGTAADGFLDGTVTGRFLTRERMGALSGDFLGSIDGVQGTWQGAALGTYSGSALAFSSDVEADFSSLTMGHSGEYSYGVSGDFYSYRYDGTNTFGYSTDYRYSLGWEVDTDYRADGTVETRTFTLDGYGNWQLSSSVLGIWDPATTSLADILAIPRGTDPVTLTWSSDEYLKNNTGHLTAVMGGTGSLWAGSASTPAPFLLLGDNYFSDPGGSTARLFSGRLSLGGSYSLADTSTNIGTTADGGAFTGFLSGVEGGGAARGTILGLYLDPSGTAGYLRGSLAGTDHADIGVLEMQGGLYTQPEESFDLARSRQPGGRPVRSLLVWRHSDRYRGRGRGTPELRQPLPTADPVPGRSLRVRTRLLGGLSLRERGCLRQSRRRLHLERRRGGDGQFRRLLRSELPLPFRRFRLLAGRTRRDGGRRPARRHPYRPLSHADDPRDLGGGFPGRLRPRAGNMAGERPRHLRRHPARFQRRLLE